MRRSEGARVIQFASGCIPMISECACWAIWRTSEARYASGIQSRGSIRSSAATAASNDAVRPASPAAVVSAPSAARRPEATVTMTTPSRPIVRSIDFNGRPVDRRVSTLWITEW